MRYAKILVEEMIEVLEVSSFVEEKEISQINIALFEAIGTSSIQEVRDNVVKYCSNMKVMFRAEGDWDMFDTYQNAMSKIVTVIDMVRGA